MRLIQYLKICLRYRLSTILMVLVIFNSCKKSNDNTTCRACTDSTNTIPIQDKYKPAFHFSPDNNWINDPNGLVYANGVYHLFYQYNPYGNVWGHMSWGHSTSTDLMHWTKRSVALLEEVANNKMIFSGSAVTDRNNSSGFGINNQNSLVAVYTANMPGSQNQNLAYSIDNGETWTKFSGNPVLDINSSEFRDPKVFWYAQQQKWVMVVSKPEKHEAWFYESINLKSWNFMSKWGNAGDIKRAWECPDLIEMTVEGTAEKKWVLTNSSGNPQESFGGMQYFVGDFDGNTFVPVSSYINASYLDFGKDFYAGVSFNDAPNNRKIMIGWANNWEYANDIPTGNVWRGIYSIPRELTLRKNGIEYQLYQQPVAELNALRQDSLLINQQPVLSVYDISFSGNTYELQATIEPGSATGVGIRVLKSKDEETVIRYDNVNHQLLLDRTKSGNINFNNKFASIERAHVDLQNNMLKVRILVDKSIIEVFINEGQVTLTDLVFPVKNEGRIQLFSEGGTSMFKDIKIWKIKP